MSDSLFSDDELIAYIDEMLPSERASRLERLLRTCEATRERLGALMSRRDQGGHTLGEIWRRHRLSCPEREQLGAYLLQTLEPGFAEYIRFHLDVIGCRVCQANLEDLRQSRSIDVEAPARNRRYFESSAGHLRDQHDE